MIRSIKVYHVRQSVNCTCTCTPLFLTPAGRPEDSGISLEIIQKLGPAGFPVFGVCMGHQCIGQVFGGNVVRAPCGVMHGKTSPVFHTDVGLLEGLDNPFKAARYHSLVIEKDSCPEELEVTAWCVWGRHWGGAAMGGRAGAVEEVEAIAWCSRVAGGERLGGWPVHMSVGWEMRTRE